MTDKTKWLSHPEKDGPYWLLILGSRQPVPRDVYTMEDGTRYVAKFGDDCDRPLTDYLAGDRWLVIPKPSLPHLAQIGHNPDIWVSVSQSPLAPQSPKADAGPEADTSP